MNLTAAFADGHTLYAVRYASDAHAPTLYTSIRNGGRCIVSEPFDREGGDWQAIPPASFVTISGDDIRIRPFASAAAKFALVG